MLLLGRPCVLGTCPVAWSPASGAGACLDATVRSMMSMIACNKPMLVLVSLAGRSLLPALVRCCPNLLRACIGCMVRRRLATFQAQRTPTAADRSAQCAGCSGTAPNDVCTSCAVPALWTVDAGDCRLKTCAGENFADDSSDDGTGCLMSGPACTAAPVARLAG